MTEVTLFKNVHGCVNVALRSGQTVAFLEGRFFTTNKKLEAELTEAAKDGEFGVYVDVEAPTIDPDAATPMDQLKKKLRAEILAEMAASNVDTGTSILTEEQRQQAMATTDDLPGGVNTSLISQVLQEAAQVDLAKEEPAPVEGSALSLLEKLKAGN